MFCIYKNDTPLYDIREDVMKRNQRNITMAGMTIILLLALGLNACGDSGMHIGANDPTVIDLKIGNGTGDGNPALTVGFDTRHGKGADVFVQWQTIGLTIEGISLYTGAGFGQRSAYTSAKAPTTVDMLADAPTRFRLHPQADTDYSAMALDVPESTVVFNALGRLGNDAPVRITADLGGLIAFMPRDGHFRWNTGQEAFVNILLDAAKLIDASLYSRLRQDGNGNITISASENSQVYDDVVERIIRAFTLYNDLDHNGQVDDTEAQQDPAGDSEPYKIKCDAPETYCVAPDGSYPDRRCNNGDVYECKVLRDARGCPVAEDYSTLVVDCGTDTCTRGPGNEAPAFCHYCEMIMDYCYWATAECRGSVLYTCSPVRDDYGCLLGGTMKMQKDCADSGMECNVIHSGDTSSAQCGDPDTDGDTDIEESDTPIGPRISLTPESLDMGVVALGTIMSETVDICNTGDAPLTVSQVQWSEESTDAWSFSTGIQLPADIAAGICVTINIRYTPVSTNCSETSLLITSNDPLNSIVTLPVSAGCTQTDGDVDIIDEEESETAGGAAIEVRPEEGLDLGFTAPGIAISKSLEVCNVGSEPRMIFSLGFEEGTSSEWSVEPGENIPVTIEAGTCITIDVSFTPLAELCVDVRIAEINITTNDPIRPMISFLVRGGCIPADATSDLFITASIGGCDGKAQVDLVYKTPNGISCSERNMNSTHTCNLGDYGAAFILEYATQCLDGTTETIWHQNPADGTYMICMKLSEDCDHWGFDALGEEVCLDKATPDFTISLRLNSTDPTPFATVSGALENQGDMNCWSLERVAGAYPTLPEPIF